MNQKLFTKTRVGLLCLAWLVIVWAAVQYGKAGDSTPAKPALPAVADYEDEFYAHVDRINSPTELTVTILDLWDPMDRIKGPRWPNGKAKVKPAERVITLEETFVPANAEDQKAALDFITKALEKSKYEVMCTGSSVVTKNESGKKVVCIKACVFVKDWFTLNNTLVRQGLATTTNPFYKPWEQEAKQKKLGIWRNAK